MIGLGLHPYYAPIEIEGGQFGNPLDSPTARPNKITEKRKTSPRLLLIDDDPIFSKMMSRQAKQNHIELSTCGSVKEMQAIEQYSQYDVALVDYYLGEVTAPEIISIFRDKLPVILISASSGTAFTDAPWPEPVKGFVPKSRGINALLDEALKVIRLGSNSAIAPQPNFETHTSTSGGKSAVAWTLGAALVFLMISILIFS